MYYLRCDFLADLPVADNTELSLGGNQLGLKIRSVRTMAKSALATLEGVVSHLLLQRILLVDVAG
jgi:hypothetical protein